MSRGFYVPCAPFLYLVPDGGGTPAMDCLPLQQRSPGPFHYLIHEQAKSLLALQELQNEVGALLEFRDLVMETFPHLQQKMARSVTNIPVPRRSGTGTGTGEWEPGRVKRKPSKALSQQPKSGDASGTSSAGSSAIQDSGFSSASKDKGGATSIFSSTKEKPIQDSGFSSSSKDKGSAQTGELDEAEDELWNLLDVIHRKGTKLRDEVEHLQQRLRGDGEGEGDEDDDMVGLRRERDYLLDKLAEMEAETLASRVRTSQLQTELGTLVAAKRDLEEQLRVAVTHKTGKRPDDHDPEVTDPGGRIPRYLQRLGTLDGIISSPTRLPKVTADPDKVAAILQEFNPVELQRHLLTTAVQNKVLHKRLEKVSKSQEDLVEELDKVKDENDDLRFQLEEKNIELEGTRARVRVLERLQHKCCGEQDATHHSSSTESAHDQVEIPAEKTPASPKKRPSKIPLPGLKSYTAPKPPSGKTANKNKADPSSLSGGKASSWKNNSSLLSGGGKSVKNSSSLSARQSSRESLSGSKSRDSLSGKNSLSSTKTHSSYSSSLSTKKDSSKGLVSRRLSNASSRIVEQGGADQNSKLQNENE